MRRNPRAYKWEYAYRKSYIFNAIIGAKSYEYVGIKEERIAIK